MVHSLRRVSVCKVGSFIYMLMKHVDTKGIVVENPLELFMNEWLSVAWCYE